MLDTYIEECCIARHLVTVITINGFQMVGKIIDHDDKAIVVLCGNAKKLVFKHAISTIEPLNCLTKATP